MIQLAFYKARGELLDQLIRWWTCGPYSHVELVIGDTAGVVQILSSSPREGGVREKSLLLDPAHWQFAAVAGDEVAAAAFIREHIGASYDWTGIIMSQILPWGWHDPDRWFCSEIVTEALVRAGALPFDTGLPSQIDPNALFAQVSAPVPGVLPV